MSEENVEIVRRVWDLWKEGPDQGNLGVAWDHGLAAPDSTLHTPGEVLGSASYIGRDGFIEFTRLWTEDFEEWTIQPERFLDAGDDRVVLIVSQTAKGKTSSVPVEFRAGIIYTLVNERITDIHMHRSPEEALEAAGLSE